MGIYVGRWRWIELQLPGRLLSGAGVHLQGFDFRDEAVFYWYEKKPDFEPTWFYEHRQRDY